MFFKLKAKLDSLLEKSIKNNVFSGCSVGLFKIEKRGIVRDFFFYGKKDPFDTGISIDETIFFDLASLTKPLVVSLCLQVLLDKDKIDLSDTLELYFSDLNKEKSAITLYNILNHSGGFPDHKPYYRELIKLSAKRRKKSLIAMILEENLIYAPGSDCVYSDLGYILLADIIENITQQRLDLFWKQHVVDPVELGEGFIFPQNEEIDPRKCVFSGKCSWSKKSLSGLVHDDNCRALGEVTGHAGLFATTPALLSFCEVLVKLYNDLSQHPNILNSSFRNNLDNYFQSRRFGFDTPTGPESSSGRFFSKNSIGHLGYTGTSLWLDLDNKTGITFLTNRVSCGDDLHQIRQLRPLVHDIIMEYLE